MIYSTDLYITPFKFPINQRLLAAILDFEVQNCQYQFTDTTIEVFQPHKHSKAHTVQFCTSNRSISIILDGRWRPFWILACKTIFPTLLRGSPKFSIFRYPSYMMNPSRNAPTHSTVTELCDMTQLNGMVPFSENIV